MSRTDRSPFSGLTVKDAVGLYVSSRKSRMWPVSIAASLRAIRDVCPHAVNRLGMGTLDRRANGTPFGARR